MNRRIQWVDVGKYICIMFVMLSHLESRTLILNKIFSPFFLNGFLFLAGYVYKTPDAFKNLIIKKVKGLIVPWLVLSNLSLMLSSIISFKSNRNFAIEALWNLAQIHYLGDLMWFLPALFVAFIPFYFFSKMSNKNIMLLTAFGLAMGSSIYSLLMPQKIYPWKNNALPWHLEYMFYAMFWMLLGYCYRHGLEEKVGKFNTLASTACLTIVYLVIVILVEDPIGIVGIFIKYLKSFIGVAVLLLLCKRIKPNKYILYVGSNTILFFCLHGKLYAFLEHFFSIRMPNFYNFCLNNVFYSSILAITITFIMSFILIVPAGIINSCFPWVIGRKKSK